MRLVRQVFPPARGDGGGQDVPIAARCFDTSDASAIPDLGDLYHDSDLTTQDSLETLAASVSILTARLQSDLGPDREPPVASNGPLLPESLPAGLFTISSSIDPIEEHRSATEASTDSAMYNPAFTDEESTRRRDFDERPYPARLVRFD